MTKEHAAAFATRIRLGEKVRYEAERENLYVIFDDRRVALIGDRWKDVTVKLLSRWRPAKPAQMFVDYGPSRRSRYTSHLLAALDKRAAE